MSFSTAKEIISKNLENVANVPIEIDFHGGEPFLNFELIKKLCEWCWEEYKDRDFKFFTTTNGSLINKEIAQWLEKNHKKFVAALSYDGTPGMNFLNRGTRLSEDILNLFFRLWPLQPVKMTISPKTLPKVANGIIFLHNRGFKVNANLAYGIDWNEELLSTYKKELYKVADFYLSHLEVLVMRMFEKHLAPVLSSETVIRHCGAGKNMIAYDINGNAYPCQMFIPNTLEATKWKEISKLDFENDDSLYDDEECKGCVIHNICDTCYGNNYLERGDIGLRDKRLCRFNIVEKRVVSYYIIKKLLATSITRELSKEEYLELSAAIKIIGTFDKKKKV